MLAMLVAMSVIGCDGRPAATPSGPASAPGQVLPGIATLSREADLFDAELTGYFTLVEQGDYGAARIRLKKHLTLNPGDGQAAFLFGLTHQREQNYAKARPWFEQAIRDAPNYDGTYYFYGAALTYLGEADLARAAFEHHLHFNPDSGDSILGLAMLDLEAGDTSAAEPRLRAAISHLAGNEARTRDLSDAHLHLSRILRDRNELASARANLDQAVRVNPLNAGAWHALAQVCRQMSDPEAADAAQAEHDRLAARAGNEPESQ